MWQRQWSWKPDRYDACGVVAGLIVGVVFGLLIGSVDGVRAWVLGAYVGCALATVMSFMLRRLTPRGCAELRERIEAADRKATGPSRPHLRVVPVSSRQ
jgi:hypothetical protein